MHGMRALLHCWVRLLGVLAEPACCFKGCAAGDLYVSRHVTDRQCRLPESQALRSAPGLAKASKPGLGRWKVGASRVPECGLVGSELRAFVLQVSHEDDLLLLWRWVALNAALRRCLCADPLE